MPKDFLGNTIKKGDYFAYPLTIGRSANMAVFQYVGENSSGSHKARPIERSYGIDKDRKYTKWVSGTYDENGVYQNNGYHREMTPEEKAKVDAKTSTLHFLDKRAVLLKGFKP